MTRTLMLLVVVDFLIGLAGIPSAIAQVQRESDVQGMQILERSIAAAGGRQAWKEVKDFRASGTFSLYSGGEVVDTGNAMLLGAGLKRFRLTATLNNETRTWLWSDGNGVFSAGNVHSSTIGRHNLTTLEGITLPTQKLLGLLDGPSRSIQLVESVAIDGRQAYRLRLVRTATDRKETSQLGRTSFATDFIVDQQTLVIMAIEDTIYPNSNTRDVFQHRVAYGDYRTVAGRLVPFFAKEEVSGQVTWDLHLNMLECNVELPESEFEQK